MSFSQQAAGITRFGSFELDQELGRLSRDGEPVALEAKPLAVLTLLIDAEGRLISREQIARAVWPGARGIETDAYVNTAIRKIRAALDDDPNQPDYVETVRGRGYRFKAAVSRQHPPRRARRVAVIAGLVALVVLLLAVVRFHASPPDSTPPHDAYLRAVSLVGRVDSLSDQLAVRPEVLGAAAAYPDYLPAHELAARFELDLWRATGESRHQRAARAAARRALDLHAGSPVALTVIGTLAFFHDWDEAVAERAFKRALAGAIDDYVLHRAAWFELARGQAEAGIVLMRRALERAPLSPTLHADLGWFFYRSGNYAGALAACSAMPSDQERGAGSECRHRALAQLGRFSEALHELGLESGDQSPAEVYRRAMAEQAGEAEARAASGYREAYLWAAAGHDDEALDSLAAAVNSGDPWIQLARVTPEFVSLADDPLYRELQAVLDRPRAQMREQEAPGTMTAERSN